MEVISTILVAVCVHPKEHFYLFMELRLNQLTAFERESERLKSNTFLFHARMLFKHDSQSSDWSANYSAKSLLSHN